MFRKMRGLLSAELSIDLGTANTVIYQRNQGIVLDEPSIVAVQNNNKGDTMNVIAVGDMAKTMLGRTPGNITTIRPLKEGVIADFNAAEKMLHYFIKKIQKTKYIKPSTRVVICVPCGATQVERRAIRESALSAGANEVFLVEEPMAAAVGAGISVDKANGSMVIDIGGGTTEIGIISLSGIVYSASTRIGGDRFDESIINYVRRKFGILIGDSTAEQIKKKIGCAFPRSEIFEVEVRGKNLAEGIPRTFTLNSRDVLEALQEPLSAMIESIRVALETVPPEIASDIVEKGVVLTGGSSLLKDLDKLLQQETTLPVYVAEDPLTCVVRGGAKILDMLAESEKELGFLE